MRLSKSIPLCEAFFCFVVSVVLTPGGGDTLRLPAAWRHPVVRPDSDRQLLAHLPVSAEPAGAVSGCRYGPMRENPGLAATVPVAPPLSRRGLRSWHPGKRPPGCKAQRRFANRASRRCGGSLPVVVSGAIHLFKPLSPGADTATTCRTDCPG